MGVQPGQLLAHVQLVREDHHFLKEAAFLQLAVDGGEGFGKALAEHGEPFLLDLGRAFVDALDPRLHLADAGGHVAGQCGPFRLAGLVPVLKGGDEALFKTFLQLVVPVLAFAFPERGDGEQGVVVGLEGIPVQIGESRHLIQHRGGLRRVEAEARGGPALLEREGNLHAAPRGETPDHALQTGFQSPRLKGKPPFEVQMAVVDASDFPGLRPVGVFHDATSEAGHAAQHTNSSFLRWGWLSE